MSTYESMINELNMNTAGNIAIIISNVFMLPAMIYTSVRMFIDRRPYYLELLTQFATMTVSIAYHVCDIFTCAGVWRAELWVWDRILPFQAVCICLIHIIDPMVGGLFFWWPRLLLFTITLAVNIVSVYFGDSLMYLGLLANLIALLVFMFVWHRLYEWNSDKARAFRASLDIADIIVTGVLVTLALTFFIVGGYDVREHYAGWHSTWHAMIFLSVWSAIDVRDLTRNILCFGQCGRRFRTLFAARPSDVDTPAPVVASAPAPAPAPSADAVAAPASGQSGTDGQDSVAISMEAVSSR